MKMNNIENFKRLSQFNSLKDFNNNVEMWLAEYKSSFTKSELVALKRLIRYSAKVFGVSTASVNTLIKSAKVSESTFHRMKRKAYKIGMLSSHTTTRDNGSQSANIWVFQRYKDTPIDLSKQQEKPSHQAIESNDKDRELTAPKTCPQSKTNNKLNKRYNGNETEFTSNRVPVQFKQLASNFYHKADTIEELWKVVKCATHKLNYSISEVADLACDGFRQLIRLVKKKRVKKSIYACYWGIVNNILDEMYLEDLAKMDRKMGISIDDYKMAFNLSL
ncbi:hypothetical protein [Heyndrickxia ginsengihumi]|uniref:hypothetical protein n=1 Tax=Heyndrickxia ginsengihumi TaxID=363870 RepID=UPI000472F2CA|nr:hypothetical protein [Heyndrickxia ginsengihumi]